MADPRAYLWGATGGRTVTKSDSTDLTGCRALWVGTTGNLHLRFLDTPSDTVILLNVPSGTLLPLQVTRVMAATTAADIVALY
jgi:hypothetical protein